MEENDVFSYITTEENNFKTVRVALTSSKDWNMSEHIERCTNVANAWFHKGANDGMRHYDDIVTPVIDVAFRTEGFDVKDIVPYVDDVKIALTKLDVSIAKLGVSVLELSTAVKNMATQLTEVRNHYK